MGGGRKQFIPDFEKDEEGKTGERIDGRNLIQEWESDKKNAKYIWNRAQLSNINPDDTDYLFGLFDNDHMPYHLQTIDENIDHLKPTLEEMTEKAIDILSKNDNGFFLFVEGGEIDFAHHGNYARAAMDETIEFSKAVDMARKKLSEDDTLIVVSSDHSHTMHYSGYASRAADILGLAGTGKDKLPYMTLSYGNGLGYNAHVKDGKRVDASKLDTSPYNFLYPATLPIYSETHGGDDVGVFASGPWSHLFQGTFEQNAIPHFMAYAACIGDGLVLDECMAEKNSN
jgi:alkaline phosphatase